MAGKRPKRPQRIRVFERAKLIWVTCPKVGTSSQGRAFDASDLEFTNTLSGPLDDYDTAGLVRNPVKRFVSAWANDISFTTIQHTFRAAKIDIGCDWQDEGGMRQRLKDLRSGRLKAAPRGAANIDAFIDFVGENTALAFENVHLRPQGQFWPRPGRFYAFEELPGIWERIRREIASDYGVALPPIKQENKSPSSSISLSPASRRILMDIYAEDFAFFGSSCDA